MKNRFNHTSNIVRHPYSLVEMLVVIAIIAILAGMGAGGYTVARRWLAQSRTEAILAKLKIAIESYKNDKGYYPLPQGSVVNFKLDTNAKDFTSGTHTGNELQPRNNMNNFVDYSKIQQDQSFKVPGNPNIYYVKDGWNVPADGETFGAIKYECPGKINKTSFDIYSAGNDRKFGTEDDIYVKF
jgi:prepilin-type N-terminal cleavage/methylation domain-containing protein